MRVVHVLLSSATSWGGPPAVVRDLAAALGPKGVESTVVFLADPRAPAIEFPAGVRSVPCGRDLMPKLGIASSPALPFALLREIRAADLVHLHELWHVPQAAAAVFARIVARPYLATLHGELDPWTLRQRRAFKAAAWAFYQKRVLDRAAGIHALTDRERDDVVARGVISPVRVIPNGVDVDGIRRTASGGGPAERPEPRPYILFVGRLDPKKGLDVLVDGFAQVAAERRDLRLVLAGPDTLGLWPSLREKARRLAIADRVTYAGFVDVRTKFRLMAGAESFVLPSISEGMSVAVLEALACGAPCVVSAQCYLPEIASAGAGRVVEPTPAAVSHALLGILADVSLQETMRRNAERLARERFSIERTASEMKAFYEAILSAAS